VQSSTVTAALFSVAILGSSADAALISTASHRGIAPLEFSFGAIVERLGVPATPVDRRLAQTFVPEASGDLRTISVTAGARGGVPVDAIGLTLTLATFADRQPGAVLGSVPVQHVQVSPSFGGAFSAPTVQQAVADFAGKGLALEAGETYAMIFSADSFSDSFLIIGGQFTYPSGTMGFSRPSGVFGYSAVQDIYFDVTVEAIPEPAATTLAVLIGASLTARRR
jgi:hypothetical protein